MGYSVDLRGKALEYYNESENISKTCEIFKIARSTLYKWIKLHTENGNLEPKKRTEFKTKIDYEELKKLVKEKPDLFLREYAEHFGVTPVGIFDALKKLKITRKKRPLHIKKLTPRSKKHLKNLSKI